MLEEQFNSNRYMVENIPNFKEKVKEVSNLDSATFLEVLKSRWNWYSMFYKEMLEPAIEKYVNMNTNEFSLKDIRELQQIYKTMYRVDQTILIINTVAEKKLQKIHFTLEQLVGISGFVLRKKILQILKEEKIINDDKYIYQYNDCQIETFFNQLYDKRKKYMCKNIKLYRQHGPTCAIASLMMLMNYYGVIDKCNRLIERELYRKYKSKLIDGAHFSGIAYYLQKNRIDVELLHSESQYFSNNKGYMPEMEYKYILNEYKEFIENSNIKTYCNVNITPDFIRKELEDGKIIMLAGNAGKELHSVLVCGYNNNQFFICDPLLKEKKLITCEELKNYMDTPIGKWCIVSEKQNEKVDRLLEACPKFQMQADEILK